MRAREEKRATLTRRGFIKALGVTGGGVLVAGTQLLAASRMSARRRRRLIRQQAVGALGALPGGSLNPALIPKYVTPLFGLPAMPATSLVRDSNRGPIPYYEIAFRQFQQQVLPPGLPLTTVWGYGSLTAPRTVARGGTFHTPSFTIEAQADVPLRVKWMNELKDASSGAFVPPLFAVDQTLHWANPPGPRDTATLNPLPYTGPVPEVTHLHGGHTDQESDGYPEAWFLPAASNIPAGYATRGSWYDYFRDQFHARHGVLWEPGTATFQYNNDQAATALWFHAHSLGMTRVNLYAGLSGLYLLRGGRGDAVGGLLPGAVAGRQNGRGASADSSYEVPLVIQDRSFNYDGSLFYPDSRLFFDGFAGPYVPLSDIAPIWNSEFFGNTIMVNGNTWPVLEVERRRYRFRVLNACNTRVLMLRLQNQMPFWQIGGDGGFLPAPVMLDQLLLAPSERADLIIDFSDLPAGTQVTLLNLGPDEPFGGGSPGVDFAPADPLTTGQVMQFRVVRATGVDNSTRPDHLHLPAPPALGPVDRVRRVSFNELDSAVLANVGPRIGLLGTVDLTDPLAPAGITRRWMDDPTETPVAGTTEIWEIYDFTADAHPFHIHQVEFEVVNREVFDPASINRGQVRPPAPGETGRKDSLIIYPGEITRVKAHFDLAGRYIWHCHILEHEDNEMMRPYQVLSS